MRVQNDLDQIHIPDPVAQQLARMEKTIRDLRDELETLKKDKDGEQNE